MPARKRPPDGANWHPEQVRARIRATELINRPQSHIFDGLELSLSQVRGIEILLRKCIPDLSTTTINADINVRYVAHLPEPISRQAWLEKYGGDYLDPARTIEGHVNGNGENDHQENRPAAGTTPDKILQ